MSLTSAQFEKVKKFIESQCGGLVCSACGHKHFGINNHPVAAPFVEIEPNGGLTVHPSGAAVLIQVTCQHCGSVRFFSAAVMGLVPGSSGG